MDLSLWAKYTSSEKEREKGEGGELLRLLHGNADDIAKLREVTIRVLIRYLFFCAFVISYSSSFSNNRSDVFRC